MAQPATFLEEYLESITSLPAEIKRNFELMRELDVDSVGLSKQLTTKRREYMEGAKKRLRDKAMQDAAKVVKDSDSLEEISRLHKSAVEKADEKIAIAMQTYDMIDKNIQDLDHKLKQFEHELRQSGEYQENFRGEDNKTGRGGAKAPLSAAHGKVKGTNQRKRGRSHGANTSAGASGRQSVPDMPIDPNEPTYCVCQRVSFGEMVGCDNDNCEIEWFHYECVGLSEQPKGKWYCPACVATMAPDRKKHRKGRGRGHRA